MMDNEKLFDRKILHEKAAEALNKSGSKLLGLVSRTPFKDRGTESFESRREPAETLTDGDIIGEPKLAYSDITGRIRTRYFVQDRQEVGLSDDNYQDLRRLAEKIRKTPPFDLGFSEEFVEELIFDWWADCTKGQSNDTLTDRLCATAESVVARHHIIVPVAAIEVQAPFQFGHVLIAPMDGSLIANMFNEAAENNPEQIALIEQARDRHLKELAHLTAVHVSTVGEPIFADNKAKKVAFDIAAMFRFMSPAALTWNVGFPCYPHGCDQIRSTTTLRIEGDKVSSLSQSIIDRGMFTWKLATKELTEHMQGGFENLAIFFEDQETSGFQKRVRSAFVAFSEGVGSFSPNNRLVYAMSALEHLFLRSEQEPIQNGVGERLAFILAKEPHRRREILANFKRAYALRSKQVHHLATVDDEETLSQFFLNAWLGVHRAIQVSRSYKTQAEFLDAIDEVKFGG